MVFVIFMLGVGLRRQKLKPRPKSDLTLGIGLEVWQISWQVILLNLFWYSVTVISLITSHASAVVGLFGSASNPSRLKRFSLNLESRSSAFYFSSNLCLLEFLNSCWRIWYFRFGWIRLDLLFLGGSFPFTFTFPLPSEVAFFRVLVLGSWCSAVLVGFISCHFSISWFTRLHSWWLWMVGLPVLGLKSFSALFF